MTTTDSIRPTVALWLAAWRATDPRDDAPAGELFTDYTRFAADHAEPAASQCAFGRALSELGAGREKRRINDRVVLLRTGLRSAGDAARQRHEPSTSPNMDTQTESASKPGTDLRDALNEYDYLRRECPDEATRDEGLARVLAALPHLPTPTPAVADALARAARARDVLGLTVYRDGTGVVPASMSYVSASDWHQRARPLLDALTTDVLALASLHSSVDAIDAAMANRTLAGQLAGAEHEAKQAWEAHADAMRKLDAIADVLACELGYDPRQAPAAGEPADAAEGLRVLLVARRHDAEGHAARLDEARGQLAARERELGEVTYQRDMSRDAHADFMRHAIARENEWRAERDEAVAQSSRATDALLAARVDRDAARARLAAAEAAQRFAGKVLDHFTEHWGDLDGADVQEWLADAGLLAPEVVAARCGEFCGCADASADFPTECFRTTDAGRAALATLPAPAPAPTPDAEGVTRCGCGSVLTLPESMGMGRCIFCRVALAAEDATGRQWCAQCALNGSGKFQIGADGKCPNPKCVLATPDAEGARDHA